MASERWTSANGGRWTIRNRIVCWLIGHDRLETPTVVNDRLEGWICTRCNDTALLRDRATGEYMREWSSSRALPPHDGAQQ